jgi:tetratricopeptide (TPR) repeat protein
MFLLALLIQLVPCAGASEDDAVRRFNAALSAQDWPRLDEVSAAGLDRDPGNTMYLAGRLFALSALIEGLDDTRGNRRARENLREEYARLVHEMETSDNDVRDFRRIWRAQQRVPDVPVLEPRVPCPDAARSAYDAAEAHFGAGRHGPAEAAYAEATQSCPDNPTYWLHRGDNFFRAGDMPRARQHFEAALDRSPCYSTGLRYLADTLPPGHPKQRVLRTAAAACNPNDLLAQRDFAHEVERHGGTAIRPIRWPDDPEGWKALDKALRKKRRVDDPLERRLAAVQWGLEVKRFDTPLWAALSDAQDAGQLRGAVLFHTFDMDLVDALHADVLGGPPPDDGVVRYLLEASAPEGPAEP